MLSRVLLTAVVSALLMIGCEKPDDDTAPPTPPATPPPTPTAMIPASEQA